MFVDYNKLEKGIGKKLLLHVERFAKKQNIKRLELDSSPFAYEFYKNRGFKPLKKGKVCSRCLPDMRMEKRLK